MNRVKKDRRQYKHHGNFYSKTPLLGLALVTVLLTILFVLAAYGEFSGGSLLTASAVGIQPVAINESIPVSPDEPLIEPIPEETAQPTDDPPPDEKAENPIEIPENVGEDLSETEEKAEAGNIVDVPEIPEAVEEVVEPEETPELPVEIPAELPLSVQAEPDSEVGVQNKASATSCGYVSENITLTADVSAGETCFSINKSGVILDCGSNKITYATKGPPAAKHGMGVNITGMFGNITIKNCLIEEGTSNGTNNFGVYFNSSTMGTLVNNTIITHGTGAYATYVWNTSWMNLSNNTLITNRSSGLVLFYANHSTITHNRANITGVGGSAWGVYLFNYSDHSIIENNVISMMGLASRGIQVYAARNVTVSHNSVNTSGAMSYALRLTPYLNDSYFINNTFNVSGVIAIALITDRSENTAIELNWFESNNLRSAASNALYLFNGSKNTFINNNFTAPDDLEILDLSMNNTVNYFIYNNSFGRIEWTNNNSGSFLTNLTLNITNDMYLGLGPNILIANNSIAINHSAFSPKLINSSANITIKNLNFTAATNIYYLHNYSNSSNFIQSDGDDCTDANCTTSFFSRNKKIDNIQFNTSAVGSFSALGCGKIIDDTSSLSAHVKGECTEHEFTITRDNITFDCKGYQINGTGKTGIMIDWQKNVTVKNCQIFNYTVGINMSNVTDSLILNNTISKNPSTAGVNRGSGIELQFNNSNNEIINNTVTHFSSQGGWLYAGIRIRASINVTNNTKNLFRRNNLSHNYYGFGSDGVRNRFKDNFVFNNTYGYFFYNQYFITENNFTNEEIRNNSHGIGDYSDRVYGDKFRNSTFVGNNYDARFVDYTRPGLFYAVNTSVNISKVDLESTELHIQMYVDVNVTNADGVAVEAATVDVLNSVGELQSTGYTNSNGEVRLEVTEFYRSSGVNYYVTPTTFRVSKNNFSLNSSAVNLRDLEYSQLNLSITEINCSSSIVSPVELISNYSCLLDPFSVGADEVNITGKGTTVIGNRSQTGFSLTGRKNVNLANFTMRNLSRAVYMEYANNSVIRKTDFFNNTYGIVFNYSDNNTVYDSIFDNNSIDVYAINDGLTNNSLVNVTINVSNITVSGSATVYLRWYVDVNVTFNELNTPLSNANVLAYFNRTMELDKSGVTDSNGKARLELAELKVNSSGTYYLTNHSINISFEYKGSMITNTTNINLSRTNNTKVNLHIDLNCTSPSDNLKLSSDTTFCPGTYDAAFMEVNQSHLNITCDGTTLDYDRVPNSANRGLRIKDVSNVSVNFCTFKDFVDGVVIRNSTNVTINNNTFALDQSQSNFGSRGVWCRKNSYEANITQNYFSRGGGTDSFTGVRMGSCNYSQINNNTFADVSTGVSLSSSKGTSIFYNDFSSASADYHLSIQGFVGGPVGTSNISLNTTIGTYTRGNKWSDYCGKGKDSDDDGYADAPSVDEFDNSRGDWPYNKTISTKMSAANSDPIDYGPLMHPCVTEVQLGSSSSSSSSTSATSSSGSAAPSAPDSGPSAAPSAASGSSLAEYQKYLESKIKDIKETGEIIEVTLAVANTGDFDMLLDPDVVGESDHFYLITRKTTAGEDLIDLAGISVAEESPDARFLRATLQQESQKQLVLKPGEQRDISVKIKPPALQLEPKEFKIVLKSFDQVVNENGVTVKKSSLTGAALDHLADKNALDLYLVVSPAEETAASETASPSRSAMQGVTGAVTGSSRQFAEEFDEYLFEVAVNKRDFGDSTINGKKLPVRFTFFQWLWGMISKEESRFVDVYGPYKIRKGEGFIFAQKFKYDPSVFQGEHIIETKLIKEGEVIVENGFDIELK